MCLCRMIEKRNKLYFYSVDCVAGAEFSRYTDDQDVVRFRQTNRK